MAYHNGMQFTTIDVNNDLKSGENGAAHEKFGGWWFNTCADVNLNGLYGTVSSKSAIYWLPWQYYTPMKTISMMAKRYP
jgi:hypothetical protein